MNTTVTEPGLDFPLKQKIKTESLTSNYYKEQSLFKATIPTLIQLIDYTRLEDNDTSDAMSNFCQQAITPQGPVAAVCVYPQFIKLAKSIATNVPIATVVNFPNGAANTETTCAEIRHVLSLGADEIDVVMPYHLIMAGKHDEAYQFLLQIRTACQDIPLKVILETGALKEAQEIALAADIAINADANFIKTSTGKIETGATSTAVCTMLTALKNNSKNCGIKISGGIRTKAQAIEYLKLIEEVMGSAWINNNNVRIGASQLLGTLLEDASS